MTDTASRRVVAGEAAEPNLGIQAGDGLEENVLMNDGNDCSNVECRRCGQSFNNHRGLMSHINQAHGKYVSRYFSCQHCDEVLPSETLLNHHTETDHCGLAVKSKTVTKCFPCQFCCRKFSNTDCWLIHLQCHTQERYQCQICFSQFTTRRDFEDHIGQHSLVKMYKCTVCTERFVYRICCDRHVESEHLSRETKAGDKNNKRTRTKRQRVDIQSKVTVPKLRKRAKRDSGTSERTQPKTVRCETCGFLFETDEKMLEHAKKHLEAKQFICETCGAAYKELKTLEAHRFVHTGHSPFKCDQCEKSFRSRALLSGHKRKHKPGKRDWVCAKCGKAYRSLSTLTIHEASHSDSKPCTCAVCGRGFSTDGNLKRHMSMHTGELKFSCEHCPRKFRVKRSMFTHMEKHVQEKPFKCESCDKHFAYEWNRKEHQQAHVYVKTYQNRSGAKKPVLDHYKELKGVSDPGGNCQICGKFLPTGFGLYRHMVMHKREPLQCKVCGLKFTLKVHYDNHQAVHSGKTFSCPQCSKEFVTEERMLIHEREVHTGVKPYVCDVCSEGFITKMRLKAHERIHKGKAIVCQVCQKFFVSNGALEKHMRQHTVVQNEKTKFKCQFCDKNFKDFQTFSKHQSSHEVKKYTCQCGKVYTDATEHANCMQIHQKVIPLESLAVTSGHRAMMPVQNYETRETELRLPPDVGGAILTPYHITLDDVHGTIYVCGLCQQSYLTQDAFIEHSKLHLY